MTLLFSNLRCARSKWSVAALSFFAACAILSAGCGNTSEAPEAPPERRGGAPGGAAVSTEFQVRSELVFSTRADLAFEVPGEVGVVSVAVGDLVSEGDVLATIDTETFYDLRYSEAQAKFKLDKAQEELNAALDLESPDPLVRAKAESNLAKAEVALDRAEDALEDYQLDYDVALGAARKAVADAEYNLDAAEEAVTDFADSHGETFAVALAARSAARLKLEGAKDAVADFVPLYNESVAALESSIAATEQRLDAARTKLRDFDADHANQLAVAQLKLAEAETQLETAEDTFTEFHIKVIDGQFPSLQDGRNFDVVQFNALQAAVAAARRDVEFWEKEIDELAAGPKQIDRTAAVSTVARLQSELGRLNQQLGEERAGPDQDELDRLEANELVAQEELDRSDRNLAEVEEGVDQLELARLQAATDSARLALEAADSNLSKLDEGIDETVLADLTRTVAAAREARDELAEGPDAAAVELARANLVAAQVDYQEILDDLDRSELRAPFAGLVRLITIEPGDVITVDARAIQMVDPTDVSVIGMVETNHIDRIEIGTMASVTLGSLPGVELEAIAEDKSGGARTERGVISFPVVFSVSVPPDVAIPPNPGLVTTTVIP